MDWQQSPSRRENLHFRCRFQLLFTLIQFKKSFALDMNSTCPANARPPPPLPDQPASALGSLRSLADIWAVSVRAIDYNQNESG